MYREKDTFPKKVNILKLNILDTKSRASPKYIIKAVPIVG